MTEHVQRKVTHVSGRVEYLDTCAGCGRSWPCAHNWEAWQAEHDARRVEKIKLEVLDRAGNESLVRFEDEKEGLVSLSAPLGITPAQALKLVDAFNVGREWGQRDGREQLQSELRDLLDVARRE